MRSTTTTTTTFAATCAVLLLASTATAFVAPVRGVAVAAAPRAAPAQSRALRPLSAVIPGDTVAETILIGGSIYFFSIYNALVTIRILLSWFPQAQGVSFLQPIYVVTEPFLRLFRGIVPPIGGLDLSLIPALLLLQFAGGAVASLGADPSLLLH